MTQDCPLCGNSAGNTVLDGVPEMQFGMGESFDYLRCGSCAALSLLKVPGNMARYYPEGYYAHAAPSPAASRGAKRALKRLRTVGALRLGAVLPGSVLRRVAPEWLCQLRGLGLRLSAPILDVGCGNGARLFVMRDAGFTNLVGIDPFASQPVDLPGLSIGSSSLAEVGGKHALIMFNHSFEHMAQPGTVLQEAAGLLAFAGIIVIRTPMADSAAFERYGRHWAQIDAPRHIHVHTPASIRVLAGYAGLELRKVEYDSTAFQFWGSEQYLQGITLEDERSWLRSPGASRFTDKQVADWEAQARGLNAQGRGDQAVLYLAKA